MSSRRDRKRRPARRSPRLEPKKTFLIVCEGKNTEPQYFLGFAAACKNPRVELEVVAEGAVPLTVVKRACEKQRSAAKNARKEKDDNLKYDSVWAVFDVDDHPKLSAAIEMARDNDVELAISNPAFELWLLLHFQDHPGLKDRTAVRRLLDKHIQDYDKTVKYSDYQRGYDDAVRRAKPLGDHDLTSCQPGPNPSTGVHLLTESIRTG